MQLPIRGALLDTACFETPVGKYICLNERVIMMSVPALSYAEVIRRGDWRGCLPPLHIRLLLFSITKSLVNEEINARI